MFFLKKGGKLRKGMSRPPKYESLATPLHFVFLSEKKKCSNWMAILSTSTTLDETIRWASKIIHFNIKKFQI